LTGLRLEYPGPTGELTVLPQTTYLDLGGQGTYVEWAGKGGTEADGRKGKGKGASREGLS